MRHRVVRNRTSWPLLVMVTLTCCDSGETPPPADGGDEGGLGTSCDCEGGNYCPAMECHTDLSCVFGLCSSECDPYDSNSCPDGFHCVRQDDEQAFDGFYCRPAPYCLAEAGNDSLLTANGPIGTSCEPPRNGEATITGTVFMVPYTSPQKALYRKLSARADRGTFVNIGTDLEVMTNLPEGQCGVQKTTLLLEVPCRALTLGMHSVGGAGEITATLEYLDGDDRATAGSVTFDGYDPNRGLCGTVDLRFDNEANGTLTGPFMAGEYCE